MKICAFENIASCHHFCCVFSWGVQSLRFCFSFIYRHASSFVLCRKGQSSQWCHEVQPCGVSSESVGSWGPSGLEYRMQISQCCGRLFLWDHKDFFCSRSLCEVENRRCALFTLSARGLVIGFRKDLCKGQKWVRKLFLWRIEPQRNITCQVVGSPITSLSQVLTKF